MINGDEWKEGTPYEDPEDRLVRELQEWTLRLAENLSNISQAMGGVLNSSKGLAEGEGRRLLRERGLSEGEAADVVRECRLIAEAEGRNFARALKAEIARHNLDTGDSET